MKTCIKTSFIVPVLVAVFGLVAVGQVTAQSFTTLYNFTATSQFGRPRTNTDGGNPFGGLVLSGGTLFGTTSRDGTNGTGTVFALNTDGTGFRVLHSFAYSDLLPVNSDGAAPYAGLMLSGSTLYGTTSRGGIFGNGTVFSITIDGTGFTILHSFSAPSSTNSDGSNPDSALILSGNTLYGTTFDYGSLGGGTVFAVNSDGTGVTTLHSFTSALPPAYINGDGANPVAGLLLSGNILYGTTLSGGGGAGGTVFAVNTDGTGFRTLHSFSGSDGNEPEASLIMSGNTLYGTTFAGSGRVFAINTNGTGFKLLHVFTLPSGPVGASIATNSDGANPNGGLVLANDTLYGTTTYGGTWGNGTVFVVNTDGTGFSVLYNFTGSSSNFFGVYTNSDGSNPQAGLTFSANTLYGTTSGGGVSGNGTVFSLLFTPELTITPFGRNIILSWPTNYAGFDYSSYSLQSTTNLSSPFWTANLPAPVSVNGQYTVTNAITGNQQFFRLSQ
jgi:uncharacterized repeat protein (TIGR03803 family)